MIRSISGKPGAGMSLGVVHPTGLESINDQRRNVAWLLAGKPFPSRKPFEHSFSVAFRDLLHFLSKQEKKPLYLFGIDAVDLRWLAIGWGEFGHQFFARTGK